MKTAMTPTNPLWKGASPIVQFDSPGRVFAHHASDHEDA